MKIYDCITYFDEPMLFDLRLNILEPYIDEFIVSESTLTHSGQKKKINFDKKNFPKFKKKITHIIVDGEPENLIKLNSNNNNNSIYRFNASRRIAHQRDEIKKYLEKKDNNDWVIYSDSDEIPNLSENNLKFIKNKIVLFRQNVFYYKFNLKLKNVQWFGSKACRIRDLDTISNLRYIKNKKYPWWRFDVFFNKNKFINLKILNNGGWHFTMIKSPKDIYFKHKNDEHHDEFDMTGIKESDIKHMVDNAYIVYDHNADKIDFKKKWNKKNRLYLDKIKDNKLPKYLINKKKKYLNWFA